MEMTYEQKRKDIFMKQRRRNRREGRKRILISVAFMIAILMISLHTFSLVGKAQGDKEQQYKYYTSVRLNYGDTLWSVASKYMDKEHYDHLSYIAEVKKINHITDGDDVVAGKMIIVPYYSSEYLSDEK